MSEFIKPIKSDIFTIYSKSGCLYCILAKNLFTNNNYNYVVVDCDKWLIDQKTEFINFLSTYAKKDITTFPVIFDGENYIGGYQDIKKYIEELNEYKM
jgi:glutaredoxin